MRLWRSFKKIPSLPAIAAFTPAAKDKAISSGVTAPISSPAGA